MTQQNIKDTIQKLMRGTLTAEEQERVLHSDFVTQEMYKQWDMAPNMSKAEHVDKRKIWQTIERETFHRLPVGMTRFYKVYSWVASLLLLLGISGLSYYVANQVTLVSMYVVSSGIQNMEIVELPDGTKVHIGPKTKLIYPESFTASNREVTLDGQAFFNVKEDPEKPFIVRTGSMEVEALGTAFELFSYNEENSSEAILLNGKIKIDFLNPESPSKKSMILYPNEKAEYNKRNKHVTTYAVNADRYTSWRDRGFLSFEDEKLSMIIPRLEQWYGRKILCDKRVAETYKFTFKVRDESLERILYIMGKSSPIRYVKVGEEDYSLFLRR